jgi:hypothetical protein
VQINNATASKSMRQYVTGSLLLLACAPPIDKTDARQDTSSSTADSIVLERTVCYGTCPAYRLRLSDAGEIHFASRNPGDEGRTAIDTMPATTLPLLISKARAAGFFELPPNIARDSALCRDQATDHATATITVFMNDATKTVEDYHGCFETTEHGVLPRIERLRSFEDEIDSVLKSSRWVRPARRR